MATGKRGAGPGSYSKNGVNCTMNAPFAKAGSGRQGSAGANHAPFDKPQSLGGGGIPMKFFDTSMPMKKATTSNAGASSLIGITKRNPSGRRFQNTK